MKSAYFVLISFALLVSVAVASYKPLLGLAFLAGILIQFVLLEFFFVKPILNGLQKYIEEGMDNESVLPNRHARQSSNSNSAKD